MYTKNQINRMLGKLKRLESMLEQKLFQVVDTMEMKAFHTDGRYHEIPEDDCFTPCREGDVFEGEGTYCWFKGHYQVPEQLDGKKLFIYPHIKGYEGMLWVDGRPYGNFASKIIEHSHGNHYCDMLCQSAAGGQIIDIALEYYANHFIKGTQPFSEEGQKIYEIQYFPIDICVKDEEVSSFYYNLKISNQMAEVLEEKDYRRADFVRALMKIHTFICYDVEEADPEEFRQSIRKADQILRDVLKAKNSASAPYAGLIGHSHMDTAWLWHRGETEKKCARTYANQINLMDQYPEYTFIQSSAYHTQIIKEMYPALFQAIKERVAEGRYEPNGGVWIECDCNIPSGEYMIRQFVWGQKFTRENFQFTSDAFWLPDTFGYSAALPQIMKGCGVKYFLTTKMAWNDTNVFPYDTFWWKGIDGSKVLVHFNRTHVWPDPATLSENLLETGRNTIQEREVSNMRLISYGFGDGGGGPEFGMIEMARRLEDLEGMPKTSHTTVSTFMQELEQKIVDPSTYNGELYLELHRGTLTNQHTIKRNNRKAEFALRDLEYLTVRDAVREGKEASSEAIDPLTNEMLINQFHDILPGTCIPRAHDEAIQAVSHIIESAQKMSQELLAKEVKKEKDAVTLLNTLSFDRKDVAYIPFKECYVKGNYKQQVVEDLEGVKKLAIAGLDIPAMGSQVLFLTQEKKETASVFQYQGNVLHTPLMLIKFSENGYIESLKDKRNGRELRGEGYALNTFLIAEDVSTAWDSWDLDADCECKFRDNAKLLKREIVSDGEVEFRIRSQYQLTAKSTLVQDMIFYADSPEIVFETKMDWYDDHRFLKTAFDTTIMSDYASQEVQFGYIRRMTNRNTSIEKAKFEVSNHKYTDLSETRYGAAVLNDCKYGISVKDSQMRLSLHKGGCRPDYRGDKGIHKCTYAFLPHMGSLSAERVIFPAYELNEKPLFADGIIQQKSFVKVDTDHIIVETVKPLEKQEKGFILRVYEAEGSEDTATLTFGIPVKALEETNMLEESKQVFEASEKLELRFHPFEIKTIKVNY